VIESLARAVELTDLPAGATVVFAGGLVRSHPELVPMLGQALAGMRVEGSRASQQAKSAAYLGVMDRLS
jgi:hypothetical protein